jgi:PAS domain S-box-containing protein
MLEAVFQATSAGLLVVDVKGKLVRMNGALGRMIGLTREGALPPPSERLALLHLATPDGTPYMTEQLPGLRALRGESVLDEPASLIRPDGSPAALAISAAPIRDGSGAITGAVLRLLDTTARFAAEVGLRRSNAALGMLSRCNEGLLRSGSEEVLFKAVCQAVVEDGGYLFAWVGVPEDDAGKTVRVVARAGRDDGYLDRARLVWADEVHGRGPSGLALREGRLVINLDIERDPSVAPWREEALARGFRAVTALPLVRDGQRLGVLVMYSGHTRAPEPTELQVLAQMADDLAFGVANLRAAREQREGAARLAESEARYRQLFQHMLHGFTWCKLIRDERGLVVDWVYLGVNEAFERITGLQDVVGRRVTELFPDLREAYPALFATYARVAAGGPPERFELDFLPLGGRTFSASVHSPLPDQLVSVFDDVTDQRRAAAAIQRSEERFRALVEKSSEMVFLLDEHGRLGFWPKAATQALGLGEEQVGKDASSLVHPADVERLRKEFLELRRQPGSALPLSLRVATQRGTWRDLEGVLHNLLGEPAVNAVVATLRDVTAQRELEAKYRQSQKLESIGRLAGGVAHDFNNLLTVILSCSEALDTSVQSGSPIFAEDIDEIRQAGLRARDLTRQLLAFARKQVIAPVRLDLNHSVRSSEKLLRRVLGEDVELVVETAIDLWPTLADPGQIEQVLLNLAVNARDAMPGGGQLTLRTRNEEAGHAASQGPAQGHVQLIVRDTGSGIPAEVKEHLFEPFFTTKELGKGTGLGLATVHGIVAQAGGHVHVESEPGNGATFTICLPRTSAVTPSRPTMQALRPPKTTGTERLLLVEDDPRVRAITLRALQGAGYQVDVAANGAEALALARERKAFDLVVTDVVMPGPGVGEVVEGLRAGRPQLKVLYISGYTHDAISRQGVLEAGTRFLAKPFTASALLARVRAVLDEPVQAESPQGSPR